MNIIDKQWRLFESAVIPLSANAIQRTEMRRAFYAGAGAILGIVVDTGEDHVNEADAIATLESMLIEIDIFVNKVKNHQA